MKGKEVKTVIDDKTCLMLDYLSSCDSCGSTRIAAKTPGSFVVGLVGAERPSVLGPDQR